MSKNIDLAFQDWQEKVKNKFTKTEWVTVFTRNSVHADIDQGCIYSALIANSEVDRIMESYQWELSPGHGLPGLVYDYIDGERYTSYSRRSNSGIEPLVYIRDFHAIKDSYYEVSEEFRLYFNLYEDRKSLTQCTYLYIDENGDTEEVVLISEAEVKVKLKFIKRYLSAREMQLAIYFDFMRFSELTIEEAGYSELDDVVQNKNIIYSINVSDIDIGDNYKSQGWLVGKKMIVGLKDYKLDIFNKNGDKSHEDFIIGIDEDGNDIIHTCNEEKLSNYFGKNPGSPHYLTPVFFKKEVLTKYYNNPNKYIVDDGYLHCQGLWGLRIDNNHKKYIIAFLGDLGCLGENEQQYWKSYNIASQEDMSQVAWKRGFKAEFADPEQADLSFKHELQKFQEKWFLKYGWYFFKPLSEDDSHHLISLHVPVTDDQKEFDEQILSLTKIVIDSLNEKELAKGITIEKENPKGIDKLEAFLLSKEFSDEEIIKFIRNLQSLRSTSSAHRKSDKNPSLKKVKAFFDFDNNTLQEIFTDILRKLISILDTFDKRLLNDKQ